MPPTICLNANTEQMVVQAKEADAVTIVGYGNSKNKWNGYAEVELCTHETPVEAPEVEVKMPETEPENETTISFTELPFPAQRKGFNVVNQWVHLETFAVAVDHFRWYSNTLSKLGLWHGRVLKVEICIIATLQRRVELCSSSRPPLVVARNNISTVFGKAAREPKRTTEDYVAFCPPQR